MRGKIQNFVLAIDGRIGEILFLKKFVLEQLGNSDALPGVESEHLVNELAQFRRGVRRQFRGVLFSFFVQFVEEIEKLIKIALAFSTAGVGEGLIAGEEADAAAAKGPDVYGFGDLVGQSFWFLAENGQMTTSRRAHVFRR